MHDARARSSELSDCCPQFGVEPFVFQGERRGGAGCLHELPLLCQAGGVDDRGDAPALVLDGCGDLSLWWRVDLHRATVGVYVSVLVWHPVGELQGVVAERCGERVA